MKTAESQMREAECDRKKKRAIQKAEWRAANRDKISAYNAAYSANNRERIASRSSGRVRDKAARNSRCRILYALNRDMVLSQRAARKALNPGAARAREAERYIKNKDKKLAASAAHRVSHPEIAREASRKRRAIKRGATIGSSVAITLWERKWRNSPVVVCYWCQRRVKPKNCHADHIIALSIGGPHDLGNLAISCSGCNSRKGARSISSWNESISQPVLL